MRGPGTRTVRTRIKVIPSFGKGTLPTLVFKVGGPQGYPSDLSPSVSFGCRDAVGMLLAAGIPFGMLSAAVMLLGS